MWEVLSRVTMPDTKSGRERKGRGKRRQLENHLTRRELEADEEPPEPTLETIDSEYLDEPGEAAAE
ncbi:hypothetical protein SAMN06264867_102289 [Halorubrum cibi]|uniref:Uncharacterized protein n=2 Tax=Halorubrum cibi TaxID=413815 RepID=A0A521BJR6_9EURY|nr:hypothetical protein SAMN06264867_102289 [Halorubrum cibi]